MTLVAGLSHASLHNSSQDMLHAEKTHHCTKKGQRKKPREEEQEKTRIPPTMLSIESGTAVTAKICLSLQVLQPSPAKQECKNQGSGARISHRRTSKDAQTAKVGPVRLHRNKEHSLTMSVMRDPRKPSRKRARKLVNSM